MNNIAQPKHRVQDRNDKPKPTENKPTDRSTNNSRAAGTKFTGQSQAEHRKTNNRNKNY